MSPNQIEIDTTRQHAELRHGVLGLCARFGGAYWRRLEAERGYAVEFVEAMTTGGFGSANPERIGGWEVT